MNKMFLKRRYFDMRTGNGILSPVLQFGNFIMLSYLTINEVIPIWLFAPIFLISILFLYTAVGNKFRKVQVSTDINMNYEKSTEAVKSNYFVAKRLNDISDHLGMKRDSDFDKRMQYQKDIGDHKI